jgi:hypothetical protein
MALATEGQGFGKLRGSAERDGASILPYLTLWVLASVLSIISSDIRLGLGIAGLLSLSIFFVNTRWCSWAW